MKKFFQQGTIILVSLLVVCKGWQNNTFLCPENITSDNITCLIDQDDFTVEISETPSKIRVVEYNLDRNGFGGDSPYENGLDEIVSIFSNNGTHGVGPLSQTDVLLLSEVARDCGKYGAYFNGAEYIAKALNMSYVYVVEYTQLEAGVFDHQCTIGNAVLSRFPIKKAEQLRYSHQCCKYGGRWGGRIAAIAEIALNNTFSFIAYGTHLESGKSDFLDLVDSLYIKLQQSYELVANAALKDSKHIIMAGDFNAPFADYDPINVVLETEGYKDAHSAIPYLARETCPFDDILTKIHLDVLDYIFYRKGYAKLENAFICNKKMSQICYGATDHFPLVAEFSF